MAHPQIAAFASSADGNTASVRKIEGQKTLLGRTMHAIPYDPIHDEFSVPQEIGQAVLTFRGGANGEEAPIRIIQGPLTQIRDIERVDIDPIHNEIFIPQGDRVLVFPREANGNVAPIRILRSTGDFRLGSALAVDPVHNLLIVSGSVRTGGEGDRNQRLNQARLLIFNRTDEGEAKPKAAIGGPQSQFRGSSGPFIAYPPKNEIITGVGGGGGLSNDLGYVGVWSIYDNGDVPPRWVIGGPHGVFQQIRGVALDVKDKSLIVSDKRLNAVMTFYFPEMF